MKLTKDIFDKAVEKASASIANVKIMFNWGAPSSLNSTEYDAAVINHKMLFNNYQDGLAHFFEEDQTKLLTSSFAGISIGSTSNALSDSDLNATGYGTFSGTDLILIPEKMCYEDWTVIINFEEQDCPSDTNKNRILLSSKQGCGVESSGTTTTTPTPLNAGFSIGINGAKNIFYEYYDMNDVLRKHTMLHPLNDKNIIAVSKSKNTQSVDIYIFDAVESKVLETSINIEKQRLTEKWYLGGTYPMAAAEDKNQMFVGKIYEFLLFSSYLSKDQFLQISQALLADNITNTGYTTVTENYYPNTGFTEEQVQIGTEITGYTTEATTIQDENNDTITIYESVPQYSPVYETQTTFTQSTTAATREIDQYQEGATVYDYTYIKDYAPSCISLSTTDSSSKDYQMFTCVQHTEDIGKKGRVIGGEFLLGEDYASTKSIVIYINGLLQEEGVDYTRVGIKINKYTGTYAEDDVLIYDVVDNGVQDFIDFAGASGNVNHSGRTGQDVYLDGKKLLYSDEYQDGWTLPANESTVFASNLPTGRMAFVTRHSNIKAPSELYGQPWSGSVISFLDLEFPLISEQLWMSGVRKLRDSDYSLRSTCDLNQANNAKTNVKTTLIYENNASYFNI